MVLPSVRHLSLQHLRVRQLNSQDLALKQLCAGLPQLLCAGLPRLLGEGLPRSAAFVRVMRCCLHARAALAGCALLLVCRVAQAGRGGRRRRLAVSQGDWTPHCRRRPHPRASRANCWMNCQMKFRMNCWMRRAWGGRADGLLFGRA